ncbi:MAG TPA: DUF4236 domain-containing protein, partial [Bradyrhizobium sp.]
GFEMPIRFRKRIRLLPGIWLNLSKTGITTSVGGDGGTVNYGKRGTRTTLGIPRTGLELYPDQFADAAGLGRPAPQRAGRARAGHCAVDLSDPLPDPGHGVRHRK